MVHVVIKDRPPMRDVAMQQACTDYDIVLFAFHRMACTYVNAGVILKKSADAIGSRNGIYIEFFEAFSRGV